MTLEQRVEHLERSARRWRLASVLMGLSIAMAACVAASRAQEGGPDDRAEAAAGPAVPEEIRARKITVVNEEGRATVTITAEKEVGQITVNDPDRARGGFRLISHSGATAMKLAAPEKEGRRGPEVYLSAGAMDAPGIQTNAALVMRPTAPADDAESRPYLSLDVNPRGAYGIMRDRKGQRIWEAGQAPPERDPE